MTKRQAKEELNSYKTFSPTTENNEIICALDLSARLNREKDLVFQDENSYLNFLKNVTHEENGTRVINDEFCEDKVLTETFEGTTQIFTMKMIRESV